MFLCIYFDTLSKGRKEGLGARIGGNVAQQEIIISNHTSGPRIRGVYINLSIIYEGENVTCYFIFGWFDSWKCPQGFRISSKKVHNEWVFNCAFNMCLSMPCVKFHVLRAPLLTHWEHIRQPSYVLVVFIYELNWPLSWGQNPQFDLLGPNWQQTWEGRVFTSSLFFNKLISFLGLSVTNLKIKINESLVYI